MTPEELSRIREIYEQALPMDGPQRNAFLDRECREDQTTREEVERLLKARDNVPTWLDRPASALPNLAGQHLAGYTLVREIGRGGMGVVYLAERSDGAFHKRAAIKLVLPPAISTAVLARFQQEREILASLDHPNIARLLDAGVTEEGWPYFVMEFVDGQPILRWCDERKLNVSKRLELFRGVIDAIQYAHQRLVVHRDLKPGNILVTGDGIVKLLDFGIAKVLSPSVAGQAPDTVTLAAMMTPEYASPEQVTGSPITTLSDIYSLGVVLYELLTGHRPYRLLSAAMHEMARVIVEVEPSRPSEIVTTTESNSGRDRTPITPERVSAAREGDPNRLRKRLSGDLDSILLMALRKEPERRYGSAESFAEDLRRHLEQRPVNARESTPWERFHRFRRRNPEGFAAAVLVGILALAGLATVLWQVRYSLQGAQKHPGFVPFLAPLWLYSEIALGIVCATVYFARTTMAGRLGAFGGGLVFGLGMMGRWWLESNLGWWHSRFAGNADPLKLFSPWNYLVCSLMGAALLLILAMIGRRFGWKGQAIALAVFGPYQAARERLWFGEFMPALTFQSGVMQFLGSVVMLIAAVAIALRVMRLIGGPAGPRPERK